MQTTDISHHISGSFIQDLKGLRNNLLNMGGLIETQLVHAVDAVFSGDSNPRLRVSNDDHEVDDLDVIIDEEYETLHRIGDDAENRCKYGSIWSGAETFAKRILRLKVR